MSKFKKVLRVLYPVIIWAGTLAIPLFIIGIIVILDAFPRNNKPNESLVFYGYFVLASIACSFPALLAFIIAYCICILSKQSAKTTKIVLLLMNFVNIVVSVALVGDLWLGMFFLGFIALFIPSTVLILLIKIPEKVDAPSNEPFNGNQNEKLNE